MQFTRTRRPIVIQSLRPPVRPLVATASSVAHRSPDRAELLGACALIAAFVVMAMFG